MHGKRQDEATLVENVTAVATRLAAVVRAHPRAFDALFSQRISALDMTLEQVAIAAGELDPLARLLWETWLHLAAARHEIGIRPLVQMPLNRKSGRAIRLLLIFIFILIFIFEAVVLVSRLHLSVWPQKQKRAPLPAEPLPSFPVALPEVRRRVVLRVPADVWRVVGEYAAETLHFCARVDGLVTQALLTEPIPLTSLLERARDLAAAHAHASASAR
jgi:hypothetical protein